MLATCLLSRHSNASYKAHGTASVSCRLLIVRAGSRNDVDLQPLCWRLVLVLIPGGLSWCVFSLKLGFV